MTRTRTADPLTVMPRPRWLAQAIDAWSALATRDPYIRDRYGIDGARCPIIGRPDRSGYVCLFHVRHVSDPAATTCDAR